LIDNKTMEQNLPQKHLKLTPIFITAALALLVVFLGAAYQASRRSQVAPVPSSEEVRAVQARLVAGSVIRPDSHALGSKTPVLVLTQFSDYACASCAAGWEISKRLVEQYADDPRFAFVFRQSPIEVAHKNARKAAEAAEAAAAQGKFWEMHQALFDTQDDWRGLPYPLDYFDSLAERVGVADLKRFREEVQSGRYSSVVARDKDDASRYSIKATPTFFINEERYDGQMSLADLKAAVAELLAK
jgi:protein-disulfide isomerase